MTGPEGTERELELGNHAGIASGIVFWKKEKNMGKENSRVNKFFHTHLFQTAGKCLGVLGKPRVSVLG